MAEKLIVKYLNDILESIEQIESTDNSTHRKPI